MRIELKGQYSSEPARLTVELSPFSGEAVRGVFQLAVRDWGFKFPCALRGEDLAQFVNELREIHRSLEGTARLISSIDDVEILFTVEHAARGILSIHGSSKHVYMHVPGNILQQHPADAGLRVKFGGVLIDQSYVPDVVEKIAGYLQDEGT